MSGFVISRTIQEKPDRLVRPLDTVRATVDREVDHVEVLLQRGDDRRVDTRWQLLFKCIWHSVGAYFHSSFMTRNLQMNGIQNIKKKLVFGIFQGIFSIKK